jgi:5-methyltetrahydropteroyltriglutamate--homocysteine methyltransferase
MKRSIGRILTSHAGSLPRPNELREMLIAKDSGQPYDADGFNLRVRSAVAEVVHKQVESGVDIINDGELSKINFTAYARQRLNEVEERKSEPGRPRFKIYGRDEAEFPDYFAARGTSNIREAVCVGPLKYIGQSAVQADIENLKAALEGVKAEEAFIPAVAPGTIEHWLENQYYANDEAYLTAIADAMHEEYIAIVDGGLILQIDDPDLPDAWQIHPEMDIPAYRKFAELRVEALNYSLRGIPTDRVRFHACWGSYHGPHKYDIPLRDILDLILKVNAECYSIEASNPATSMNGVCGKRLNCRPENRSCRGWWAMRATSLSIPNWWRSA